MPKRPLERLAAFLARDSVIRQGPALRLVLARSASEGWIERNPGRGWSFLTLVDSAEAYRENYRFRQMIEPVSMRSPEFRVDLARIDQMAAQQEDGDVERAADLLEQHLASEEIRKAIARHGGDEAA